MSLIILSSRCRFSDCFKAFSNAGIVTSIFEWFQMALNKLAIITTQFLLQQNEASRGYKWIHHYCPFLSAILPAVGPDSGNEGLRPWLYSFTCSWSKVLTALFPILHQVDIIFQCSGFKWGKNELDKSTETRQQESIIAFDVLQKNPGFWKKSEIQHWNCYYSVSLGLALICSQSPWHVLSIKWVQGEWICLNHC